VEKPVVSVGNQMELSFLLEIFREKKEYLQRYSSFLCFTGVIGLSLYRLRHPSAMLLDQLSDGE